MTKGARLSYYGQTNWIHRMRKYGNGYDWRDDKQKYSVFK